MFEKPLSFLSEIEPAYCEELNRMREIRRGAPVDPTSQDTFHTCPPLGKQTLAAISNGGKITGFKIYLPDNAAGAHAEGSHKVKIPVTDTIIEKARPPYKMIYSSLKSITFISNRYAATSQSGAKLGSTMRLFSLRKSEMRFMSSVLNSKSRMSKLSRM